MDWDWRRLFRIRDDYGRINTPLVASLGILASFALVIIIGLAVNNYQIRSYEKDMTYVDNLSNYASYMDYTAREGLYIALNTAMRENGVEKPPYSGGVIREGTYQQATLDTDRYASKFIIDVPQAQQSYQVYLAWNGFDNVDLPDNLVILQCPQSNQMIYHDFNCQEPPLLTAEAATKAENYLPYAEYNDEGVAIFTIRMQRGNQKETIFLDLWACDDPDLAKKSEQAGRDWLEKETKINLENYYLEVNNNCPISTEE